MMQKSQTCTEPKAVADEHNDEDHDDNNGDSDKMMNRENF